MPPNIAARSRMPTSPWPPGLSAAGAPLPLSEMVSSLQVGDPADPATEIGPLVAKRQQERVEKYIALGQEEGAKVVVGGNVLPSGVDKGWYVQPTVFANAQNDMRIAREEIFGPVVAVIPFDDVNDAVAVGVVDGVGKIGLD